MGKWFRVHSVSSAIGRSMVLILFMASLIAVVAMVTLFYSVPDAKAINLSGSLRMQAYRMAYEIEKDQPVLGRLAQFEQTGRVGIGRSAVKSVVALITCLAFGGLFGTSELRQYVALQARHFHLCHRVASVRLDQRRIQR